MKCVDQITQALEVSVGGVKIEKTEQFCYLGHMVAKDGRSVISDAAINYRKGQERAKIAQIKSLLKVAGPSPKWRADIVKIFCLGSAVHGSEALILTDARIRSLDVLMTECRFLILNKKRRKCGKIGRQLRREIMVWQTRKVFYTHIMDIIAKKNLNFLLNSIYLDCPSKLVRKLLFTRLLPDSGDYRLNGGQVKSSLWSSYIRCLTWATGAKDGAAKIALRDLVTKVYNEAIEMR